MTIGFLYLDAKDRDPDEGFRMARGMVKSAKKVMPDVPVVQFTDPASRAVKGVDAVRRKPSEPMGLLRMRHCAGVSGEWLFVDCDILFKKKVTGVFKREFDVALTSRNWSHLKAAAGFSERMPFNTGVVFSRCPRFWGEVYTRLRWLDADLQHFMGEQQVINQVAAEGRYHVRRVRGSKYNLPPEVPGANPTSKELEEEACILHFKGKERKAMMLKRLGKCA